MRRLFLYAYCCALTLCLTCESVWGSERSSPFEAHGVGADNGSLQMIPKDHHGDKRGSKHDLTPGKLEAYAKAVLVVQQGETVFIGPIDSEMPFAVVPLAASPSSNKNFAYDTNTNGLIAHKSGTYLAEFFIELGVSGHVGSLPPVVVGLRRTRGSASEFLGLTDLGVATNNDSSGGRGRPGVASGTHQVLLKLCKGDSVQLVVTALPPSTEWSFEPDVSSSANELASLTLIRVGD